MEENKKISFKIICKCIISLIFFIIGICLFNVKIADSVDYMEEYRIISISFFLEALIVSPIFDIICNKLKRDFTTSKKIVLMYFTLVIPLLWIYIENISSIFTLYGDMRGFTSYILIYASILIFWIIMFIFCNKFSLKKYKNSKILSIIFVIMIMIIPYISLKCFYLYKLRNVINKYNIKPEILVDKKIESINNNGNNIILSGLRFENLDGYSFDDNNIVRMKDSDGNVLYNIWIQKDNDVIKETIKTLKKENIKYVSSFYFYLKSNKINNTSDLDKHILDSKKMNLMSSFYDLYYTSFLYPVIIRNEMKYQKVNYKNYEVYIISYLQGNSMMFNVEITYNDTHYSVMFVGNNNSLKFDDIYDFISTLNIEESNNNKTNKNNNIIEEKFDTILNQKPLLKDASEEDGIFKYETQCISKEEDNCVEENIIINDNSYYVSPTATIVYKDNHIIIIDEGGSGFSGEIKIINDTGVEVFNTSYVATLCPISGKDECTYFGLREDQEKIYYIEYKDGNYLLKSVDINNTYNTKEIDKIMNYQQAG